MVTVVFYCMLTNGVDFVNSVVLFYCDLLCLCCFVDSLLTLLVCLDLGLCLFGFACGLF